MSAIWSNTVHLYGQTIFRNVSVAATTTIIRDDNTTDQIRRVLVGIYFVMHTSLHFGSPLQQEPIYLHKLLHLCQDWVHRFPPPPQKKKIYESLKNSRHVNSYIEPVTSAAPAYSRRHHKKFSLLDDLTSGICVPLIKMYYRVLRIMKCYLKFMIYNRSSVPQYTTQAVGSLFIAHPFEFG